MTVAQLLFQATAAHTKYRMATGSKKRPVVDEAGVRAGLIEAYTLRTQANLLDPNHLDPAWASEQALTHSAIDTNQSLLDFYVRQIKLWGDDVPVVTSPVDPLIVAPPQPAVFPSQLDEIQSDVQGLSDNIIELN